MASAGLTEAAASTCKMRRTKPISTSPSKGDGTDPAELKAQNLVFAQPGTPTQIVIASRPTPCVNFRTDPRM